MLKFTNTTEIRREKTAGTTFPITFRSNYGCCVYTIFAMYCFLKKQLSQPFVGKVT